MNINAFSANTAVFAATTGLTRIPWQDPAQAERVRKFDPALHWAEWTNFRSYLRAGDQKLRVAIQLADEAQRLAWLDLVAAEASLDKKDRSVEIAPHYLNRLAVPGTRFFSARVVYANMYGRFADMIERLSVALVSAPGEPSKGPQSQVEAGNFLSLHWPLGQQKLFTLYGKKKVKLTKKAISAKKLSSAAAALPQAPSRPVMGIIDFGCAFAHERFRESGAVAATRVRRFWDQGRLPPDASTPGAAMNLWTACERFGYGRETTKEALDALMQAVAATTPGRPLSERALYEAAHLPELGGGATHGTGVLDIACGAHDADTASQCDIVFVQLPRAAVEDMSGGWLTVYVMDALEYIVHHAGDGPLAINLSFGSYAGAHDGTSLLEEAIESLHGRRTAFAMTLAAGNTFDREIHRRLELGPGQTSVLHWALPAGDTTQSAMEIWYRQPPDDTTGASPRLSASLRFESGGTQVVAPIKVDDRDRACVMGLDMGNTLSDRVATMLHRPPLKGSDLGMVLINVAPTQTGQGWQVPLPAGVWTVELSADAASSRVEIHAWIERNNPDGQGDQEDRLQSTFASPPTEQQVDRLVTLTGQANGASPFVVGAYTLQFGELLACSASGPSLGARVAPDCCAPGAIDEDHGLDVAGSFSDQDTEAAGTSLAAPLVARRLLNIMAAAAGPLNRTQLSAQLVQGFGTQSPDPRRGQCRIDKNGQAF